MILLFYFAFFWFAIELARSLKLAFFGFGMAYAISVLSLSLGFIASESLSNAALITTLFLIVFSLALRFKSKSSDFLAFVKSHRLFIFFLIFYTLFLFWQGPYDEIPADGAGGHLFRIGEWLHRSNVNFALNPKVLTEGTPSLGYIFNSALLKISHFQILFSLRLLFVFNTLFLTMTLYACSYAISRSQFTSLLSIVVCFAIWGTSSYSFVRYYSYAPALLAMLLVLESFTLLFSFFKDRGLSSKTVLGGLYTYFFVAWVTHKQEALLIAITGLVFLTFEAFTNPSRQLQTTLRRLLAAGVAILVLGITFGAQTGALIQGAASSRNELLYLGQWQDVKFLMANPLGDRIRETVNRALAFGTILTLVWTLYQFTQQGWRRWMSGRRSVVFILGLAPFVLILFPPTATILSFFFYDMVMFRVLYLPFIFISFAILIQEIWSIKKWPFAQPLAAGLTCMILIFSALGRNNRLIHLISPVDTDEGIGRWLPIYQKINAMNLPMSTTIFTDPITAYPLNFFTGLHSATCVHHRCEFPTQNWGMPQTLSHVEEVFQGFDYVLVNSDRGFSMSRFPNHWPADVRNLSHYYHPLFQSWLQNSVREGWAEETPFAPGFVLYKSLILDQEKKRKLTGDLQ